MQHPATLTTLQVEQAIRAFMGETPGAYAHEPDPLDVTVEQRATERAIRHFKENPEDEKAFARMAIDFDFFLKFCWVAAEGQELFCLGDNPWEAQKNFIRDTRLYRWLFVLKARQLGQSTIEVAYDLWRTRFGARGARTHIISRTETEAISLLKEVKYMHEKLPFWAQLPVGRDVDNEYILDADGKDDERVLHAYSTNSPGRGETATHVHLDEWSDHDNPLKTMIAVEPSVAPGGTFHIVTTGNGPQNYASIYYRSCMARSTQHVPIFYDALQRDGRNPQWLEDKRRSIGDDSKAKQEYPMTWEEAISGGGELRFASRIIDTASRYAIGETGYLKTRPHPSTRVPTPTRYIGAYDTGRSHDPSVLLILDVTFPVWQVVYYRQFRNMPFPQQGIEIEKAAADYPTATFIVEKNGIGWPVLEGLNLPDYRVHGWTNTRPAKLLGLQAIQIQLEKQELKWKGTPQSATDEPIHHFLDAEMRGYMFPDDNVVQDSVMALLMAVQAALGDTVKRPGTVMGVISG